MANVKTKLVKPPEWWQHLRKTKRVFWKKNRQAEKNLTNIKDKGEL